MTDTELAIRYARALFDLSREQGSLDDINRDMQAVEMICRELPQVVAYCTRKRASHRGESEFVKTAFIPYVSSLSSHTILTAVENGRIAILPHMPRAFVRVQDNINKIQRLVIETARELEPETVEEISAALQRRLSTEVRLELKQDPGLLGGMRILINSRLIDLSVAGRLRQLRRWIKSGQ